MPAKNTSFHYQPGKAIACAAYLLELESGSMEYVRLLKLMYLADRRHLEKHNHPITGDRAVSMKHGPVLSEAYRQIREPDHRQAEWARTIAIEQYRARLVAERANVGRLSRAEIATLREVREEYQYLGTWDLVELLHDTLPEWHDPGAGMAPIAPRTIMSALGKTEEEIEHALQTATDDRAFDDLFAVR